MPTHAKYRLKLDNFKLTKLRDFVDPKLIAQFDAIFRFDQVGDQKVYLCNLSKDQFEQALETPPNDKHFVIDHQNVDHFAVVMIINDKLLEGGKFKGGFCCRTFQDYLYFDQLDYWNEDGYLAKRFTNYLFNENNTAYLAWKNNKITPFEMKYVNSQNWGWSINKYK